jgi:hypothetical protein
MQIESWAALIFFHIKSTGLPSLMKFSAKQGIQLISLLIVDLVFEG